MDVSSGDIPFWMLAVSFTVTSTGRIVPASESQATKANDSMEMNISLA
jgi:hypothetical protein